MMSLALLRDLSRLLESNPGIDLATINSKLKLLGWNGVTLDYQSLQLALVETKVGTDRVYHPPLNLHYQEVSRFR